MYEPYRVAAKNNKKELIQELRTVLLFFSYEGFKKWSFFIEF